MKLGTKKIMSFLIVTVMLLSVFIPNIALAIGGDPSLTVSVTKTDLKRGDEFTAIVSYNSNGSTEVEGMEFDLQYDSAVLEVVSATQITSEGNPTLNSGISGAVKYVSWSSSSLDFSGNLFSVTFRVKSDATGGSSTVRIVGPEAGAHEPLTNGNADEIRTTVTNANIFVNVAGTAIALSQNSLELYEGSSESLSVIYTPADTTDTDITWTTSDSNVATVSNGIVSGVSRGTATITATTKAGLTASCNVTVKREITSIVLNKYSLGLNKGDSEQLIATIPEDSDGDKTITWTSSNPTVAFVSTSGVVLAMDKGTAVITATTSNGKTATCTVSVGVLLQSISFEDDITTKTLKMGVTGEDSFQLNVIYNPIDTDVDKTTLVWASTDTSVASVSDDGTVTARGSGDANITASIAGKEATCAVHVEVPILSIDIKDETELTYGEEEKLEVTFNTYNQLDTTDDKTIKWTSSDEGVATVTTDGTIITNGAGTAVITATSVANDTITDTCNVTVNPAPLQSIVIKEQSVLLEKGDTQTLTVEFNPDKTTDSKNITWESSDTAVVTIDANGTVTGLSNGTSTITAITDNGLTAETTITVVTTLKNIILSETDVTINKGIPLTLTATLDPIDATLDDYTIQWSSSNTDVATVDQNGEVTTYKAGTAYIYATVGGKTAECKVNVNVPLEKITMIDTIDLLKGQSQTLEVTKEPEGTNFDGTITFDTSDSTHVTVDRTGKIEAISSTEADGPTTITANAVDTNGIIVATAKCLVTVIEIPLDSIAIDHADFSLGLGRTQKLSVLYNPENTTDDRTVTWTSLNTDAATVDANGNVKAIAVGEAVIMAEVDGKVAMVTVTTHEIPITGITVYTNLSNNKIAIGKAITLTVKVEPEDATRQGNYKFTSSDESILTVDDKGNVIARGLGKTLITVETENGIKEQVEIEVVSDSAAAAAAYKTLSPKTGDIQIELFTAIMIVSALGIAIILITNKKNK
ncbi:MAG: Ig-like domain-containing protein [Clostridia bacterium]|nr:Ig-like domain-containing protein [Clostridia bacterium]